MTAGERASERLLADKEALARAITARLYEDMPELAERYGDYGRGKCLEDMRYNLEHLAPAVDLAQPELFAAYVRWLDGLLRSRNVGGGELVRSLELTERVLAEQLAPDEAEAAVPSLRAGLQALRQGGRP